MPASISSCIEEEYSLFVSCLWRRRGGWRPLLIYFRGPGGVPFFIAAFLTLIGLWRFARRPQRLADIDATAFQDAKVLGVCSHLGSYGMGGPGFVGLKLKLPSGRRIWVVFTIWGAAGWLTVGDDLLSDGYSPSDQQQLANARRFRLLSEFVGSTLKGVRLQQDIAELTFSGAAGPLHLCLRGDSSSLPVHSGSKQPKVLAASQDVRDAVIVSRRASLWLGH